jgi:hypothetical protein
MSAARSSAPSSSSTQPRRRWTPTKKRRLRTAPSHVAHRPPVRARPRPRAGRTRRGRSVGPELEPGNHEPAPDEDVAAASTVPSVPGCTKIITLPAMTTAPNSAPRRHGKVGFAAGGEVGLHPLELGSLAAASASGVEVDADDVVPAASRSHLTGPAPGVDHLLTALLLSSPSTRSASPHGPAYGCSRRAHRAS